MIAAVRFTIARLGQVLLTVFVVSLATFVFLRLAPGDPVSIMLGPQAGNPEAVAAVRAEHRLDDPWLLQYVHWVVGIFQGDLGRSFLYKAEVTDLILSRLPTTVTLVAYGGVLALLVGVALGLLAARSPRVVDGAISTFLAIGLATPSYVTAVVLISIFSLSLNWFPVFGSGGGGSLGERLYFLTLPAITLALSASAALARITRASVLEEGGRDHVTAATARGFGREAIFRRHVVRNALLPVVTLGGIMMGALIAGTVIVEQAYGLDGLGSLLVRAVTRQDYAVVQSVTVIVVLGFLVSNAIVDLLYPILDPRTRPTRLP